MEFGEVVLLSPLGYSPTGEVFNVTLEDVATATAIALDADKLMFLMDTDGVQDKKGKLLKDLTSPRHKACCPPNASCRMTCHCSCLAQYAPAKPVWRAPT